MELIAANGGVGIQVMAEICWNGLEMPAELVLSIVVSIIKEKCDIQNCSCYRAVKLIEHGMKVLEKVLEKDLFQ